MGGSETLVKENPTEISPPVLTEQVGVSQPIAPENTVHGIPETMPYEQVAYTHQLSDGTVVRAESAEDAISRCPVLGRLALQSPEKAHLLLRLGASGREAPRAEVVQPEKSVPERSSATPGKSMFTRERREMAPAEADKQPAVGIPERTDYVLPEQPLETQYAVMEAVHAAVPERELTVPKSEPEPDNTKKTELHAVQPEAVVKPVEVSVPPPSARQMPLEKPAETLLAPNPLELTPEHPVVSAQESASAPAVTPATAPESPAKYPSEMITAPEKLPVQLPESVTLESLANLEENHQQPESDETIEAARELPSPNFTVEQADQAEVTELQLPEPIEYPTEKYDQEIMYTYEQLIAVTEKSSDNQDAVNQDVPADFLKDMPDGGMSIDAGEMLHAEPERPLEDVLEQLAMPPEAPLDQKPEATQDVEKDYSAESVREAELQEVLQDIAALLSKPAASQQPEAPSLTPELTEKLLQLTELLGYKNPSEALVGFAERHGAEYLIDTVQCISSFRTADVLPEMMQYGASFVGHDNSNTRIQLGKLLFRLIAGTTARPAPLVV